MSTSGFPFKVLEEYGDSFFVFDQDLFDQNFNDLFRSFDSRYNGSFSLGYSFKTNYTPSVCKRVLSHGGYAEVVSSLEYEHAIRLGFSPSRIIFNGPWKSTSSFQSALINNSIVNLDNDFDIHRLISFCSQHIDRTFSCCIRLNAPISGHISRFGFDFYSNSFEQTVSALESVPNLQVVGIHCHFPFRSLESFEERSKFIVDAYCSLARRFPLRICNIGGGFMGPITSDMSNILGVSPVTYDDYAETICSYLNRGFDAQLFNLPLLIIEPGTALVSNTFKFYTKVLATKCISANHYAFVSSSLFDISPNSRFQSLPVRVYHNSTVREASEPRNYTVCGFTCIESDILSHDLYADLSHGDILEFSNVGSYSVVMRPPFILPHFPIITKIGDSFMLSRRQGSYDDIFSSFLGL